MAQRQTYESHLVGVGLPMTGDKLTGVGTYTDSIRYLPFAQGLAYGYQKNIVRERMLSNDDFEFNRQINWSEVSVSIRQFDYYIDDAAYNSILEDVHITERGVSIATGVATPIIKQLAQNDRDRDGAAIYFLTDTGQIYRDQIDNQDTYWKQYTIFDPCYLASITWSNSIGSVATYEFEFVGNYIEQDSVQGNMLNWDIRKPFKSGTAYSAKTNVADARDSDSYLNLESASGLFQAVDTTISGAPDFGEIRGASWTLSLERTNIYSLGNPMILDRKLAPMSVGSLTLEYNYEGQEIDGASFLDAEYTIAITNTNLFGKQHVYTIYGANLQSVQLNSSTDGSPDTYSAQFSFPVSPTTGLFITKY